MVPPLGRDDELARCDAVIALLAEQRVPASPHALLVSGDAGIGKTTLVRAVVERARAIGAAVGIGHCVDVSGGLPFGPVVEAARQLGGPGVALPGTESRNAVGLFVRTMADLASDRPALIVLEDLHWADQYTADFVRAFVRTAEAQVLLLMTYRSEDVSATAALRETLVDLRRSDALTLLPLGPLDAAAIGALATRRTGRYLGDDEALLLHGRSEGNPLYAEEIVAADMSGISPSLADLLTRHVRGLSPPTRALVRLAAAASSVVDVETLGLVADLNSEPVETALREAMDANVLVRQGRGFAFRHALLRDAIYEDLLPTERARLHATYVAALRGRLATATAAADRWPIASDLAFHADAAGDRAAALSAHVAAADAARRYGARSDAAEHYESALALWKQVPAADRPTDVTTADLHRLAADSLFTLGVPQRILDHLRHALSMLDDDTDATLASRVYASMAGLPHFPIELLSDEDAAVRAVSLIGPEPSEERVDAMLAMARVAERRLRFAAVLDHVAAAQQTWKQLGHPSERYEFLTLKGHALWLLGRCREGIEQFRDAAELALQAEDVGESIDAMGEAAWLLLMMGRSGESESLARSGQLQAHRVGLSLNASFGMEQEIVAFILTGRFGAAQRVLDDMSASQPPEYRFRYLSAALALARGDLDRAHEHQMRREELLRDLVYLPYEDAAVHRAAVYRALGDPDREVFWARRFIDASGDTDSPLMASIAAYVGLYALSGGQRGAALNALREPAYGAMSFAQAGLTSSWEGTWYAAHLSFARAYAARLEGRPALDEWGEGVERAAGIGAYVALQPRLELAAEHLRTGDRATGKEQLIGVWDDARTMGAGWYERQAAALATRNRVPLPGKDEATGALHRLTPREREVLALLANGATDKDVAATLVISPRTASIHVGNILAKLQVPNRGAAAKLARDLGVGAHDG